MPFHATSRHRFDTAQLARSLALAGWLLSAGGRVDAQVTPAAGQTPPDDTPSIKLGVSVFADYTYQPTPTAKDAAGTEYSPNSFNLTRAYINVSGNLSRIIAFRVTPDVTRVSMAGTSLDGSSTYRLKFAYAQFSLDDWLPKGTWVRFGVHQTPFLESLESIYRYRLQGTVLPEREGYIVSADLGVSARTQFPNNYGDIQFGIYNGEGYGRTEVNDQKAKMLRVGFRPLPRHWLLRTWRLQGFWTWDHYMKNAPRNRAFFDTTFEHPYLNVGFDYISTEDETIAATVDGLPTGTLDGRGWSFWLTPKKALAGNGSSIEALVRYDHMKPGGTVGGATVSSPDGLNKRTIVGGAYWFPRQGNVTAAVLVDVQFEKYRNWTPEKANTTRFFVHTVFAF